MGREKRKYSRLDLIFKVHYSLDKAEKVDSVARDISKGGAAFLTTEALSVGQVVELKLSFEELNGEIPVKGEVVRCWEEAGQFIAAVEFTQIEDEDQGIIDEYIHYFEEGIFNG